MKRISLWLIAGAAAFPMVVAAQTANTPGGQASTGTPLEQTSKSQVTTPKTTRTSPDVTNPAGALPSKGSTPAADAPTTSDSTAATKRASRRATNKANTSKPGDVPTYPAPSLDGTPTK